MLLSPYGAIISVQNLVQSSITYLPMSLIGVKKLNLKVKINNKTELAACRHAFMLMCFIVSGKSDKEKLVRFQALTEASMKIRAFWCVLPPSSGRRRRR
jgi:hypothetical protein